MNSRKWHVIIGSVAIFLSITIAISVISIIDATGNKSIKKETIKHTEFVPVDKDLDDFLDDSIQNAVDNFDDSYSSDYTDDNNTNTNTGTDTNTDDTTDDTTDNDSSATTPDTSKPDDEVEDDMGWLDGSGEEDTDKTYTSEIQKEGTTPESETIRNVNIDNTKVVYKDFYGMGGCFFPEILSDQAINIGYSSTAWEWEKRNIINTKPSFARLPVMMDTIITDDEEDDQREDYWNNVDYQNYSKGIYDFDSSASKSVIEFLGALKTAGTKVYFNPGWKCIDRIKTWYPDVQSNWANSAPYDIKAFVKANIAWLIQLEKAGYGDVIKFLAFGNETNWGGDFETSVDFVKYHTVLVSTMYEAIDYAKKNTVTYYNGDEKCEGKLTGDYQIFYLDSNNGHAQHMENVFNLSDSVDKELGEGKVDNFSYHRYYYGKPEMADPNDLYRNSNYFSTYDWLSQLNEEVGRAFITETQFAWSSVDKDHVSGGHTSLWPFNTTNTDEKFNRWGTSFASLLVVAANTGSGSVLPWDYGTSWWPFLSQMGTGKIYSFGNTSDLKIPAQYRLTALLQSTINAHSDVLDVDWEGKDIRTAAFKMDATNDYTFVVEADDSEIDRTLKLNLSKGVNKKLYKYAFIDAEGKVPNSIDGQHLLSAVAEYEAGTKNITETLDKSYGVYVYSTIPPEKQVKLNSYGVKANKGTTVTFNAELIDCEADDEIVWEITAASKSKGKSLEEKNLLGTKVTNANLSTTTGKTCTLTVPADLSSGDSIAVSARVKGDENSYSIALVFVN